MIATLRRAALVVAAGVLAVPAIAAHAAPPEPPGFSSGRWVGAVHYRATISDNEGFSAVGQFDNGRFDVEWLDGSPSGAFETTGTMTITIPGAGTGEVRIGVLGEMIGPPTEPHVDPSSVSMRGSISVSGVSVPLDFDFGSIELDAFPLDILRASCNTVSGDFSEMIRVGNEQMRGRADLSASVARWSAVRVPHDADGDLFADEMADLLTFADAMVAGIEAGAPDFAGIDRLVARAQTLAQSIERNAGCDAEGASWSSSVLGGMFDRLIGAMLDSERAFSIGDWHSVVIAAVGSGTLGPGSGPAGERYAAEILEYLSLRLDGWRSLDELFAIHSMATMLGDSDLARRAAAEVDRRGMRRAAVPFATPFEGLAAIDITTAPAGGGDQPLVEWTAVDGASVYVVTALDPAGAGAYWAWRGEESQVWFGGSTVQPIVNGGGPYLFAPMTLQVWALDVDGVPIATSGDFDLAA